MVEQRNQKNRKIMCDSQLEPVVILVTPRMDWHGKPTCGGCPFLEEEYDNVSYSHYGCFVNGGTTIEDFKPKDKCPIHNKEIRDKMGPI